MSEPPAASPAPQLRDLLSSLPSYQPGRPAGQRPVGAGRGSYKLSSNENPFPPLPGVLAATSRALDELNRYPDMASSRLVAALAERLQVPADHLALGTGSVAVLAQVLAVACDPGDEVVFAWRSFEAYPILTRLAGARALAVPLAAGGRHDLSAMAAAVSARTRVVLVCTPNNPTGPAVHAEELAAFLDRVPTRVVVVLDEAYTEFVRDPGAADALAVYRNHPNVVVLRTFSKAYGLAGLRIGYAVADAPVAEALRKAALPFGVSITAQAAAVASLGEQTALDARVEALVDERTRVVSAVRAQGHDVPDAQGNFWWLSLGTRTAEFAAACESAGVSVRPFGQEGVRVTIGEHEANERVVQVAASFAPVR
ncbi:MAG: histidinol-phosphate transaminase [Actinomycetes bacterium]